MAEALPGPLSDPVSTLTEEREAYKPLGECMLAVFESNLWTDVTFRCKDQNEEDLDDRIHAHKMVLAARSPVFKAMFYGPLGKNQEVSLDDIDSDSLMVFLRSVYSDDPSRNVDDITTTITIGHKYQVMNLVDKCFNYLSTSITPDNVCTLLNLAMLYDSKILSETCSKYMDENATEVLENPGFLELSKDSLTYILKGDTFNAKETKIFRRSVEWAENTSSSADGDNIRRTLAEAFYYIRTPTMTMVEFIDCTKGKGYYSIQEYEAIVEKIAKYGEESICGDEPETLCHSSTKRLPRIKDIDPYQNRNTFSKTDVLQAVTRLLLRPKTDVFLRKIELQKVEVNVIGKPRLSFAHVAEGRYIFAVEVENVTGIQLKCVVTVDGKDISDTLVINSESNEITFEVPLPMKASSDWYDLCVSVTLVDETPRLRIRVPISEEFEKCLTDVPITFKGECRNHAIIKTITFENTHHRDKILNIIK